jgi:hypothetical protein
MEIDPLPCRYSNLDGMLEAIAEAAEARARSQAAPQTQLPYAREKRRSLR